MRAASPEHCDDAFRCVDEAAASGDEESDIDEFEAKGLDDPDSLVAARDGGSIAGLAARNPVRPEDLAATMFHALGIDSHTEIRDKLEGLGFAVRGSSAEELRTLTRDQLGKYARVIKEMGIVNE